ncbi:YbjN domain-containing protein [Aureimonas populi]|uniref:YbjN domain-containing protein n=1 Tax=Aureimonas populi TaxID=1701758 RepID=A0ABW5CG90_9HYPH|nr:YbjN domain-containing protein [Aureimonas populi]
MQLAEVQFRRQSNPVDMVELVAASRDWAFERPCDDEIEMSVDGTRARYSLSLSWMEHCEALHLGCAFELKVPAHREAEVLRLLARTNEAMLLGHFDLWPAEGAVMFRHALLLSGNAEPTSEQAERLLTLALENCERYFDAFHFVIWANKTAEEALACAMFETVGHA